MTLPALEQAPTRLLSVAADAPASAVGVCSSAALLSPEPQSSLQTSRGFRTDQANDLASPPVRSGVAALDSSRLRSIVRRAQETNGPRRLRWTQRERLAWHELVVVRGISA